MKHNVGSIKNIVSHVETAYGVKDGGDGKKETIFYILTAVLMLIPIVLALYDRFVNGHTVEMIMFIPVRKLASEGMAYYYTAAVMLISSLLSFYIFFKTISLALKFSEKEKEDKRILKSLSNDLSETDIVSGKFMTVFIKTGAMMAFVFGLRALFYLITGPFISALLYSVPMIIVLLISNGLTIMITLLVAENKNNKMPWLTAFGIILVLGFVNLVFSLLINVGIKSSVASLVGGIAVSNPDSLIKVLSYGTIAGINSLIYVIIIFVSYRMLAKKQNLQKVRA